VGFQPSYGKGTHSLWAGSRDTLRKITTWYTYHLKYFYSVYIIYKFGRGPYTTTWWAAGRVLQHGEPRAVYYNMVSRELKSYDPVDVLFGVNKKKFKRMLIIHVKLNDKETVDFDGSFL
jgi:hypothetical protein